jgi:hypothetical protein
MTLSPHRIFLIVTKTSRFFSHLCKLSRYFPRTKLKKKNEQFQIFPNDNTTFKHFKNLILIYVCSVLRR